MEDGEPISGMVWVRITDRGVDSHEPFIGYMSKYETTNAQYCQFLNDALASGDIEVGTDNVVYGKNGSNSGEDYVGEPYFDTVDAHEYSQITYLDGTFTVRIRRDYNSNYIDMSDHPVVQVSWFGATAFANYYGYRLPTEWEWQAVADYDGNYSYGCGTTISQSMANYYDSNIGHANPLDISRPPFTSPVGYYGDFGYGLCDMAGNVREWTSSNSGSYRMCRGGSWGGSASYCNVTYQAYLAPKTCMYNHGFRLCRDLE